MFSGGSHGSVASSVAEVETQQPPTQGIKNLRIDLYNKTNGKKTEGLLYPCNKKDEVEIVCLCYGDFLNAVEFVEHGGGGYIENPLNHIFIDGE
ncbi:hypothetical protein H5410_005078 [Solanum commersonii]|uniref:Ninja-family protein n=1 Tax=Solanum commersonii TaxID=4109 RepID=A0A9J6A6L7_SOLCO|nr:hypothetical protein H5410_005078 [Solanum commersonii]